MYAVRHLLASRAGSVGTFIVVVLALVAVCGPWLAPYDPLDVDLTSRLIAPTISWMDLGAHPLGTDQIGRDILSRVIIGSRITLFIAMMAVIFGGVLGIALGLLSGFIGGWTERIVMRLADIQLSIPLMLFALLIIASLGPDLMNLILVLALTGWTRYARIVRGEVLSLREREFVLSARAAGASNLRIILRHILPNVATVAIVVATLELSRVVILESALSFLGFGVQPPFASWGRMLADGRAYITTAWWLSTFPGIAIICVVLGVNLIGDWMRDFFDPKLHASR